MTRLPWRPVVATWSVPVREWWGQRANELQDEGFAWDEAERLAFLEGHGSMDQAAKLAELAAMAGVAPEPCPAWVDDRSLLIPARSGGPVDAGPTIVRSTAAKPARPAGPILPGADAPAPHGRGTRR